jgi:hypothetical protein
VLPEENNSLENPSHCKKYNIELGVKPMRCFPVLDSGATRENKLAVGCEHTEEVLGFIQRWMIRE